MSTVLVVDDAIFVRTKNARLLSENGYGVIEAGNGQEAVDRYAEVLPDLVLMDITMPVLDGIGATRQIRSRFPDAKVVMCTALGQQSMVIEALKAGAKDFVVKPFEPEKLLSAIRRQIG